MTYYAGLSTVTLIYNKYGRDVHSYIVGIERKEKKKERKKNIELAAKKKDPAFAGSGGRE